MDFDSMKKDKEFQNWCFETELVGNKEWFNLENGSGDEVYIAYEAWVAGQQRKQAEIDTLKSKLQDIWTELDDRQSKEHIIEKCESIIQGLLK